MHISAPLPTNPIEELEKNRKRAEQELHARKLSGFGKVGKDLKRNKAVKWSPILHFLLLITLTAGLLSLVGAWIAGEGGTFFGFSQEHLYNDTNAFFLLTIGLALGVLIHRQKESNL